MTVNACDALSLLTADYVKSTIHRYVSRVNDLSFTKPTASVVSPPKDQQHVDRLGLLYFSRPHNDVPLNTIKESPVLQREGYTQNNFEKSDNEVPTMESTFSLLVFLDAFTDLSPKHGPLLNKNGNAPRVMIQRNTKLRLCYLVGRKSNMLRTTMYNNLIQMYL